MLAMLPIGDRQYRRAIFGFAIFIAIFVGYWLLRLARFF
jgi:hypothetical protein